MPKIESPYPYNERIMLYGASGSGKSKAYVDILQATDTHMYIIDNENAAERMLSEEFEGRYTVYGGATWPEIGKGVLQAANRAKVGDWIVVDMMTPVWEAAWMYYVHKAYKIDYDEMMFWMPSKGQRLDWPKIKSLYKTLIDKLTQGKAHFLGIYAETDVVMEGDWADKGMVLQMFADEGARPVGNKGDAHYYHTVIHTLKAGRNKFYLTTLKERERGGRQPEYMVRKDWSGGNFAKDYLVEEAGWKVKGLKRKRG